MPIKKIVVIGPESTGKSTLCRQLAEHYSTSWVPEFARDYLLANGCNYSYNDLLPIAEGQINSEDKYYRELINKSETATPILFIDTDLYVMKVWSEFVFNKCDNRILTMLVKRKYDLYLLCNTDLQWEPDEMREYPDLFSREKLFHHYKDALINQNVPWVEISGDYDQRFAKAIQAVEQLWPTL
jgi:NadR type nicotinamide-nucleotide adenylyltransferase